MSKTLAEAERLALRAGLVAVVRDAGKRILFTLDGDPANVVAVWFTDGRFIDARSPGRVTDIRDPALAVETAAELASKPKRRTPS